MDTIASVASSVALPLIRQFTYILMYNSYVAELEAEIQKLQRDEKEVRHTVEAAKRNGEEIEDTVRDWFCRVRAAQEEAQLFLGNEEKERVGCLDVYTRYAMSQRARNLVDTLREIRKETFERVSYRSALKCIVSSAARGYVALESRTVILNEIMKDFKDSEASMIGVYGMGGVGKTALVKELAWQAEKCGLFDVVVMVTVTNNPDVKNIRAEIADGLGLKFDEQTELGRACRLRQRIKQEVRILVILDDVWGELDLIEVGIPFGEDHPGCKLLVTSRDLNVLNANLDAEKIYRLEVLSESESWSLFEKRGGNAVNDDDSIQPVAMKIAKNSVGWPLLIVTMVEALKNKDLYAWKDMLEQLTNFHLDGCFYSQVHSAIKLSYDHLESHELKTFFLLLGSIGNDYSIKDLLVYGWCLGLHKHVDSLADGRNRLYKLIDNLRAASLLLEGERDQAVALDIVRSVAASIASTIRPFFTVQRNTKLKEWPNADFLKNCHHIFLDWCYIDELPEKLECPNLKILQLNSQGNSLKLAHNFFAEMRGLKVLSLGGLDCSPSLPPSLGLLTKLEALKLCKCMLEDIAIVGELTSLEILNLEKSELTELPAEIGKLINLRLLDLTDCSTLRVIPRNLISSLTSLEELYMGNCSIQWGVEGTENQSSNSSLNELWNLHQLTSLNMQIKDASVFPRDLIAFAKLESYKILIGDGWKPAAVESGNYRVSRVLKLNLNMDSRMLIDYGIKLLMTRAEDLSLAELKGVREVLYELNDDGFSKLKHLSILNCGEMLSLIGSIEWAHRDHVFPNLESLILQNLSNMERICSGPLPAQAFTKLGVIKVKGCDRMEFVFPHSMIKHLSELHEIEVCECKSMTKIIAEKIQEEGDGETDKIEFLNMRSLTLECLPSLVSLSPENNGSSNQLLNDKVEFPNLETLKLYSINVPRIWDGKLSACCFQNLTSLTVDGCERLTYLFSHSVAGRLVKLQHLLISSCQSVEEIFIPDNNAGVVHLLHPRKSATTEEVPIFPELETLVITKMESLKTLWPSQVTQSSFCKLKKMEITSCANLLNLFPCYILNKLQSLESLDVSHCDSIEVVYEMESLSTEGKSEEGLEIPLRSLSLGHLPNLKSLWNKDPQGLIKLQNLNNVKVTRCSRLKHVFPLSVAKDLIQLQFLAIIECGVEEIVVSGQGGEEEASLGLVFPKLISLKFVNLPELRWFCDGNHNFRFPFLNKLYVVECPAMVTFSRGISRASILRKVCLTQNGDQWLWEGDINATLSKIFNRGSYAASEMSESLSEESTGF